MATHNYNGAIDEYIAAHPEAVQKRLTVIRREVHKQAPGSTERISYQMPAFWLNGRNLLYFAAHKEHISIYPAPVNDPDFKVNLDGYAHGRGTVRFTNDKPLPRKLIQQIVAHMIKKNTAVAAAKKSKARKAVKVVGSSQGKK